MLRHLCRCAALIALAALFSCASEPADNSNGTANISTEASSAVITETNPPAMTASPVTEPEETAPPIPLKELYVYKSSYETNENYNMTNTEIDLTLSPETILYGTYICKTADAYCASSFDPYSVIYDGEWLLYNMITGESRILPFGDEKITQVYFITDRVTFELKGIWAGESLFAYYDLTANELAFGFEIAGDDVAVYGGMLIAYQHVDDSMTPDISRLYNIANKKYIGSVDGYLSGVNGDKYFALCDDNVYIRHVSIYNDNLELLSDSAFYCATATSDGNVLLINDTENFDTPTSFVILDSSGNVICESRDYDAAYYAYGDYVCVNDGGMLKLIDKNENVLAVFGEWNADMHIHTLLCQYLNSEKTVERSNYIFNLYHITQKNGESIYELEELPYTVPAALYIVCENYKIEYGNEGSGFEYYYAPETSEAGLITLNGIGAYAKPVLYLYPEEECEVSVKFEHPEYLTVTYPSYPNDGWSVSVSTDGTLMNASGRSYYALYWEESGYMPADFSTGFCVTADVAAEFLEEKLDALGFTEREANEFIMYWLPVLQRNGVSLVHFELTESRQAYNRLNITPAPDSLLRVAIHIKKIGAPVAVIPQALPHFERTGFAAVEWGGVVE